MAITIWKIALGSERLEAPEPAAGVAAGAVVDFWGVVRGTEGAKSIAGIRYEAHPRMAETWLQRVADETNAKFPLLPGCLLRHRLGPVAAGDASLHVRVCCAHRRPALEALAWLVDRLKQVVPIWKEPYASVATALHNGLDG